MTDSINEEQVRHIATLARLKLTDEEIAGISRDLAAILDHVQQLSTVDTKDVEPTAHAVQMGNVFRADEVRESMGTERALANAPQTEKTFFKVPKVLDQDIV